MQTTGTYGSTDTQGSSRILIIDDRPVIRDMLRGKLSEVTSDISEAESGTPGLDLALNAPFDLILTDVEMPGIDGYALCELLKNSPRTRSIPVVIVSMHESEAAIDRGLRAGAAAYIGKSEMDHTLVPTVRQVLSKTSFRQKNVVLVVDDSFSIRRVVRQGLEEVGFVVAEAANGQQALAMLREDPLPDLILSDIEMPAMNGVELVKRLQADPDLASIPVIIMSSHDDRALVRRMLNRGALNYLVKPFNLDQLVHAVDKTLEDRFLLLLKDRQRFENERRLMLASFTSLVTALEARDLYTRGHSESVATILTGMGVIMGLEEEDLDALRIAGTFHDIGKIGVPDQVLLKPGSLSYEEFAIIKQHPTIGAHILSPIPTVKSVIPVILHHHERMDGMGYPEGLVGAKIPLWARMAAVADTYDALTSDRPYRKGMPRERALQVIEDIRHDQLCPDCVQIFMQYISDHDPKSEMA